MRRYIEVPIQLLDIEGEGFHIMVKGMIHGKEARFLIDTGASRSVFDPVNVSKFIENLQFERHEMYGKLGLPHIDGILGGDLLKKHRATINYRAQKMRLTP